MAENGPLGIYRMSPLYNFSPDIDLPTCLYKMSNLFSEVGDSNLNSEDEDLKLLEMEKHQLNILQKLEDLKTRVLKVTEELNIPSVERLEKYRDIVIKANPNYPPLSIWIFYNLLSKSMKIRLSTYIHSSLLTIPAVIKTNALQGTSNVESCDISLSVIWRDVDKDHELMIDPVHQGIIEGEVNIARYISRLTGLNYDVEPVSSTQIDSWLEMTHASIIHGSSKERQAALRTLNSHLGKNKFLVGESQTLADIVTWSAIVQTKLYQTLPANVNTWFKLLLTTDIFQKLNELVLP